MELDGDAHDTQSQKEHDANRDAVMEKFGLTILRFKNDDIFKNAHLVVGEIERFLI